MQPCLTNLIKSLGGVFREVVQKGKTRTWKKTLRFQLLSTKICSMYWILFYTFTSFTMFFQWTCTLGKCSIQLQGRPLPVINGVIPTTSRVFFHSTHLYSATKKRRNHSIWYVEGVRSMGCRLQLVDVDAVVLMCALIFLGLLGDVEWLCWVVLCVLISWWFWRFCFFCFLAVMLKSQRGGFGRMWQCLFVLGAEDWSWVVGYTNQIERGRQNDVYDVVTEGMNIGLHGP